MIVDADVALEAVHTPAQAPADFVVAEIACQGHGAGIEVLVAGLHREMHHQFMAGGVGLAGLAPELFGIGHEGQRQRPRQADRAHRIAPVEAQIVDHHGDHRTPGGIAHGDGMALPGLGFVPRRRARLFETEVQTDRGQHFGAQYRLVVDYRLLRRDIVERRDGRRQHDRRRQRNLGDRDFWFRVVFGSDDLRPEDWRPDDWRPDDWRPDD